jgi:Kef-type K+ transport system membrane component KefB
MSGLGRWSLWIGLGLVVVAVVCSVLSLIPVSVFAGIFGGIALVMAAVDAIYNALGRAELRRRAAKVQREREQGR